MPGFNDWVSFDSAPMSALERTEEVDDAARGELAKDIQTRLRARVDPGVTLKDAGKAQSIRVAAEGDRLVIDEADQGDVLAAAGGQVDEGPDDTTVNDVNELFQMGSGVPKLVNGKLSYRTISMRSLFGEQKQDEQDQVVEAVVTESLRDGVIDAYERGLADINRRNPTK